MNLSPLTPLFVGLTLSGAMLVGSREHHRTVAGADIYKFPSVLGYLMFAVAVLFFAAPFDPGAAGDMGFQAFASRFWIFATFVVAIGVYLLKYRVVIDAEHMSVGAYLKRQIDLHDIVAATLKEGNKSAELILSFRVGRKILLSGMLTDFDALTQRLVSCAARNQAGGGM